MAVTEDDDMNAEVSTESEENLEPEQSKSVSSSHLSLLPSESTKDSNDGLDIEEKGESFGPIADLVTQFLRRIDGIGLAMTIAMPAIAKAVTKFRGDAKNTLKPHIVSEAENQFSVRVPPHQDHETSKVLKALNLIRKLDRSNIIFTTERSMFIGIFSEFDAFIGELLKLLHLEKPELFNGMAREIALSELLKFSSIEDAKHHLLEKEVDSIRRESYVDQFAILESKFSIKTLRTFREWDDFIEMAQRRNLMTHNGGVVSDQYLRALANSGYKVPSNVSVGTQLDLSYEYIMNALDVLATVAMMLAYTLWKKVSPRNEKVDNALTSVVYDTLQAERWKLAVRFTQFSLSTSMSNNIPDLTKRIRIINSAIALKNLDKDAEARNALDSCDWSACVRDFKLAVHILKDEIDDAAQVMRDIGPQGELVMRRAYHDWPLFFTFRETPQFLDAYRDIYNADFLPTIKQSTHKDGDMVNESPPPDDMDSNTAFR